MVLLNIYVYNKGFHNDILLDDILFYGISVFYVFKIVFVKINIEFYSRGFLNSF